MSRLSSRPPPILPAILPDRRSSRAGPPILPSIMPERLSRGDGGGDPLILPSIMPESMVSANLEHARVVPPSLQPGFPPSIQSPVSPQHDTNTVSTYQPNFRPSPVSSPNDTVYQPLPPHRAALPPVSTPPRPTTPPQLQPQVPRHPQAQAQQPPPQWQDSHSTYSKACPSLKDCFHSLRWYLRLTDSPAISMVGLFILGTLFALAHHVLYLSLDGKVIGEGDGLKWALRGGTAFALLSRCCFGTSVATAQIQWVWLTASRKSISIKGMDAMFAAVSDLSRFSCLEMLKKARVASLLAFLAWALPISTVFTPACLFEKVDRQSIPSGVLVFKYRYEPEGIYIAYGAAILLTIFTTGVGCFAYHQNNGLASHSFSSILQATRNPELDRVAWDRVKEDDLSEIRVRFSKGDEHELSGGETASPHPRPTRRPTFTLTDATFRPDFPLRSTVRYG